MRPGYKLLMTAFPAIAIISWKAATTNWLTEKHKGYQLSYITATRADLKQYNKFIKNGIQTVTSFFDDNYKSSFDVYIHPNRQSLDSTWQQDWNMPSFKSACWMVASGVASKLDMLASTEWDKAACGHHYNEYTKTQQLITHELVHVYHGQLNASHDFSNEDGMDWFVEGLATYASGQCDADRITAVKKAIANNKLPAGLDEFWTGELKYGLSGSIVLYIDQYYGRAILKKLLPINKKTDILKVLSCSEKDLLNNWHNFMQQQN